MRLLTLALELWLRGLFESPFSVLKEIRTAASSTNGSLKDVRLSGGTAKVEAANLLYANDLRTDALASTADHRRGTPVP